MDDEANIPTKIEQDFKQALSVSTVAYMDFISKSKFHKDHIFCFFEGQDDSLYYIPKINFNKTQCIICKNKENVLETLYKIRNESIYNKVTCMFFVDRDFTPSKPHIDLFETPCYSFENLYVNKTCYKNILKTHFHFNLGDKHFNKFLEMFINNFKKFNNFILEYNTIVYLNIKRVPQDRISIKIKTPKLLKITENDVIPQKEYFSQIQHMKELLNITQDEFLKVKNQLNQRTNAYMFFRGKNQLDFLKQFLSSLKNYYQKHYKNEHNLDFNITLNVDTDMLNTLYSCAIIPNNLTSFITTHINQIRTTLNINNANFKTTYIASLSSKKFHNKNCRWAKSITSDKIIYFNNKEEAFNNGYIPCKICKP